MKTIDISAWATQKSISDIDALGVVFMFYRNRLIRLAIGLMNDPWDAEEIVQEAFISACGKLDGFNIRSSFYLWLGKIVIDLAKSRHTTETVINSNFHLRSFEEFRSCGVDGNSYFESPENLLIAKELESSLVLAVDKLSSATRTTFLLREVEQLSYCEIARNMNCTVGTVCSRLARARSLIKLAALLNRSTK
jgi:RNA polymerase sigma-70 factor (ECF subfamily)